MLQFDMRDASPEQVLQYFEDPYKLAGVNPLVEGTQARNEVI